MTMPDLSPAQTAGTTPEIARQLLISVARDYELSAYACSSPALAKFRASRMETASQLRALATQFESVRSGAGTTLSEEPVMREARQVAANDSLVRELVAIIDRDRLSSVAQREETTGELKPCPFCGGEARTEEDGGQFRVECRECGCDQYGEFEPDAIAAWNRRAPSDPVERREGNTT